MYVQYWCASPKNNGNEINIEQELPRTKIFALRGIADHYDDSSHLSAYHDYEFLPEPCQGKPGGVESLWSGGGAE